MIVVMTFDDLVEYGTNSGAQLHDGMPWSFRLNNVPVTHETNDHYIIDTFQHFFRGDYLILNGMKSVHVVPRETFENLLK
jgi:hypothetical protein